MAFNHPYLEYFLSLNGECYNFSATSGKFTDYRKEAVKKYAWAVLGDRAVKLINEQGPLLSLGAGNGYNEWLLTREGGDVIATDVLPPRLANSFEGLRYWKTEDGKPLREWWEVEHLDASAAVHAYPERNLLFIWPCYSPRGDWDYKALRRSTCQRVVFVGEVGGCTGGDLFHDLLDTDFVEIGSTDTPRWEGLSDAVYVYARKS